MVDSASVVPGPMEVALPNRARFGAFELDLKAGELRQGGRTILLQEQPFQVLLMLVEQRRRNGHARGNPEEALAE